MDRPLLAPISRRTLFGGAFAAATGLLAACSDSPAPSGDTGATTLRIGTPSDVLLGSIQRFQAHNQPLRRTVFDYLIDKNTDGTYRAALATQWEWNAQNTSLVLKLREDVTFHTGRAFGADDVLASINQATAGGSGVQAAQLLKRASGVAKTGPYEVTVTFGKPFTGYLDALAMLPIIDSETFAQLKDGKQVIGTGPFKWQSWTPGSKLDLVRYDNCWRGKANFETLAFSIIPDAQAMLAAMRSGSLDLALRMIARDADSLKSDSRFAVSSTVGYEMYVGVNVKVKPLDDIRVRQAVAYSLDRARIADQVYKGFATPGAVPWGEGTPGITKEQIAGNGYDVAKAKALLQEAGAVGTEVSIAALAAEPTYKSIQDIVQYGLEQVGFKVKPVSYDSAQFPQHVQAGDFPGLWITDVALTSMGQVTSLLTANPLTVGKNTSNFITPEYAALVEGVTSAQTAEQQAGSSTKLTDYLLQQAFHNSIAQAKTPIVGVKGLTGVSADLTLAIDLTQAKLSA
ncbi:ABC transporter substrate-binding protein [Dactylosporangium roseum]|uniref:ABC transporter substrate-binding protein n=1 Tax=Dactylosporangium roseum TaxID=47989 RepID=A0ABY5Z1J1_9ACTN|nr:ABC transporter substrate-binding protein [Dactylosporangium roseum]UWZ34722.1 ABC transporter substrate-binding protein [Dactylosporangium roseum]